MLAATLPEKTATGALELILQITLKLKFQKKLKEIKLKKILIINLNSAFTFSFYL